MIIGFFLSAAVSTPQSSCRSSFMDQERRPVAAHLVNDAKKISHEGVREIVLKIYERPEWDARPPDPSAYAGTYRNVIAFEKILFEDPKSEILTELKKLRENEPEVFQGEFLKWLSHFIQNYLSFKKKRFEAEIRQIKKYQRNHIKSPPTQEIMSAVDPFWFDQFAGYYGAKAELALIRLVDRMGEALEEPRLKSSRLKAFLFVVPMKYNEQLHSYQEFSNQKEAEGEPGILKLEDKMEAFWTGRQRAIDESSTRLDRP